MITTAMIAYLPDDGSWCKQDLPHMTLVYAGEVADLQTSDFNALAKDAITAFRLTRTFSLNVTSVEVLGEGAEAVDALVFHPTPELLAARDLVKHWNKSQYTDYKPHATIGPVGSAFVSEVPYRGSTIEEGGEQRRRMQRFTIPTRLYFSRIAVCWGDEKLVFGDDLY